MTEPYVLEPKAAVEKMVEYWNAGAVGLARKRYSCRNRYNFEHNGIPVCCIIGSVLPEEVVEEGNIRSFRTFVQDGIVKCEDEAACEFHALQNLHDTACAQYSERSRKIQATLFVDKLIQLSEKYTSSKKVSTYQEACAA